MIIWDAIVCVHTKISFFNLSFPFLLEFLFLFLRPICDFHSPVKPMTSQPWFREIIFLPTHTVTLTPAGRRCRRRGLCPCSPPAIRALPAACSALRSPVAAGAPVTERPRFVRRRPRAPAAPPPPAFAPAALCRRARGPRGNGGHCGWRTRSFFFEMLNIV